MHQLQSLWVPASMMNGIDTQSQSWDCMKELSWKEFFRDPSKWWDDRSRKRNSLQPDFRHKITKEPLWMDSRNNPSWVRDELVRHGYEVEEAIGTASAREPFLTALWACTKNKDLSKGSKIHDELQKRGIDGKAYIEALVTMYAKCDEPERAQALLDMHSSGSVVAWTALISSYARKGQGHKALDCFEQMQVNDVLPNAVTYACMLKACARIGAIDKGKQIHYEVVEQGLLEEDIVLAGALVDMYAKCGFLQQARSVLDKLPSCNAVLWNALIAGYAEHGYGQQALKCFEEMQLQGIFPDAVTYACILKACAMIGAIGKGKQIHKEILRQGLLEQNVVLGGALVNMYAKCGALPQAQSALEKLPCRDVISWGSLIAGYAEHGQGQQALECFEQLCREGLTPTEVTYTCALKACAVIGAIDKGKQIHKEISKQGLLNHNTVLGGVLVDMYAKCGALPQARSVLEKLSCRDIVMWNSLIAGYAKDCEVEQGLRCLEEMQQDGILPDMVTFLCLLNMCSHLGLVEKGQQLFDDMGPKYGLKPNLDCFTCMVDLLGWSGHLTKAAELIEKMPFPANSALWHCLLGACQKWARVDVGTWAFEQAISLDNRHGMPYVLMVNIYAAAGMPEKAKEIEAMRIKNKAWKLPVGSSWTDSNGTVNSLFQRDQAKAAVHGR